MRILTTIARTRRVLNEYRREKKTIGFVPTMGALHEGHLSLLRKCKKQNDICVVSIFVNPAQFGPREDFAKYPRDKKKDVLLAKKENVDIIFYPSEKEIYPTGYLTHIEVAGLSETLCGRSRPGHFRGVTTVVGKLLNIMTPDRLYLGQKDAQQCVIIRKMISDLNFPAAVVICPTVREPDGLAMSSRNQYLSERERREATVLDRSLTLARDRIAGGERDAAKIRHLIEQNIRSQSQGHIDYVACVAVDSLQPLQILDGEVLVALAVRWGRTRLIDNIIVKIV
jgi:pantoate--beta-alanine ligase